MDRATKEMKDRLRFALSLSHKGQNEWAREIGASNSVVSDWLDLESDTLPGGAFLIHIPHSLNVDGHWLLTGEGHWSDKNLGAKVQLQQGLNLAAARMRALADQLTRQDAAADARATDGRRSQARARRA